MVRLPPLERIRLAFLARPLAWAGGAAALGVLAGERFGCAGALLPLAVAVIAGLCAWLDSRAPAGNTARPALLCYLACLALVSAVMVVWTWASARPAAGDVSRLAGQHAGVIGTVVTEPSLSASGRRRFLLDCDAAEVGGGRAGVGGLLWVSTRDTAALGDRVEVYGVIERPVPATDPGGFSEADWLRGHGAFAMLRTHPHSLVHLSPARQTSHPALAWRLLAVGGRQAIMDANRQALGPQSDLVNGLLFGAVDRSDPQAWEERMQRYRCAGLVHLLVVSGMQVMLIVGPLLGLLRLASGSRLATVGVVLVLVALLLLYAAMAGAGAPMRRALLMSILLAMAWPLRREPDVENTLGLALLLFLIASPFALHDIGLQITLAAIWGLTRLTPTLWALLDRGLPGAVAAEQYRRVATLRRFLLSALAGSLAATLATAPFVAHYFDQFVPVTILANPLAVPLGVGLLYAWIGGSLLNPLRPLFLAAPVHWVTRMLASWLDAVAGFFAQLAGGHLEVFPPGWAAIALTFLGYALWAAWARRQREHGRFRPLRATAALTLALLPLAWGMAVPAAPPHDLEVTSLDVGQGDSTLVRLPEGPVILIDGGGQPAGPFDVGDRVVIPALRALRIPRIDLLILTHPHDDHVGGLVAVAERYPIGAVLDSGQSAPSANYRRFLQAIRRRRIRYLLGRRGMELRWGSSTRLEILHPTGHFLQGTRSDLNNNSIVCRLLYGQTRFLFAGDAEGEAEAVMRASGQDLRAEVLKVGHHGSRFSSDEAWLRAVRPSIALISCGRDNVFGHPSPETVARLQTAGAQVFRTDQEGAVTVHSDGRRVWAERWAEKGWAPAVRTGG